MKQVAVKAVAGFEHNGRRNPADIFSVSEMHAAQLKAKGLVDIAEEGGSGEPANTLKPEAADAPVSVAPAVQAEKPAGGKRGGK
ncbi:MAG: hypothetical protein RR574_18155 [Comamonas sp.]